IVGNPDRAIPAGEKPRRRILPQAFGRREGRDAWISKAVDSIRCARPQDSFPVFEENVHSIAGQAISTSKVIDDVAMDAIKALSPTRDPKVAVAIEGHRGDLDFASIERWRYERLDGTVLQLSESQAWPLGEHPDPHGSIRGKSQGDHSVLSNVGFERFDGVYLRRTVTPVDKRGLASEPETAVAVGEYRIDRADRYSLCLSEALHRTLRHVTERRVQNIRRRSHHPHRPIGILAHVLERRKAVQLEVRAQRVVFDVRNLAAAHGPQPTSAVGEHLECFVARTALVHKVPGQKTYSVKSVDGRRIGREPQEAVGGLRDGEHTCRRGSILYVPGRVQVLCNTLVRIERVSGACRQ